MVIFIMLLPVFVVHAEHDISIQAVETEPVCHRKFHPNQLRYRQIQLHLKVWTPGHGEAGLRCDADNVIIWWVW